MYQGSKAYMKLLENKDVDAVLISSPATPILSFWRQPFLPENMFTVKSR
jgi:hypothetical protein